MHRGLVLGLLMLGGSGCATAQDASWLAGYWLSCDGGVEVSETWSDPRGPSRTMVGTSFTVEPGAISWEFNRIAPSPAGLSFFAAPSGQTPAEFPLAAAKSSATRLVFENLAHDFPQRVIFERDGANLKARIEGDMGGKTETMAWSYRPARLNERCPR